MSSFRLRASPAFIIVAMIPTWLALMDVTILNVGYDDIAASLGATLDEVSWASTAYTLAGITMLPLAGWLVSRFGRRRVFVTMLSLFALGSLLCGLATSATELAAFRLFQGLGGGLMGTVSQAILIDAYPDEYRTDAISLLSVLAIIGPILGPVVAGFVLVHFAWPMLFFINLPLAIFTIWLCFGIDIEQKAKTPPARFSFTTLALLFGTLFCFQFVLQSGQRLDWFDSAAIRWSLVSAVILGALLVFQQMRLAKPMIDLRLFANREFLVGNVLSIVAGGSNYAISFIGPLFLQQILGFSPLETGLLTIPSALALLVGNRVQDYLVRRVPLYVLLPPGMFALAVALWYNGVYADMNDLRSIMLLRLLQGFAFGVFIVPIGIFAFKTIAKKDIDSASGLFALVRQESGMIGIAAVAALVEGAQTGYFRRLLLQVPRWPVLTHHAAASQAAVVAAVSHRANVLAYQHVYAVSAAVMFGVALLIALYGLYDWLVHSGANGTTAAAAAPHA